MRCVNSNIYGKYNFYDINDIHIVPYSSNSMIYSVHSIDFSTFY